MRYTNTIEYKNSIYQTSSKKLIETSLKGTFWNTVPDLAIR